MNRDSSVSTEDLQKFKEALPGILENVEQMIEQAFGLNDGGSEITISFTEIDRNGSTLALV